MENTTLEQRLHSADEGSIEAVRELLFGKQSAEITKLIELTERSIRQNIAQSEQQAEIRFSSLQSRLHEQDSQLNSLEEEVRFETHARRQQSEEILKTLKQIELSTSHTLASLEERVDQMENQINQKLTVRSRSLFIETTSLRRDMEHLSRQIRTLSSASADRADLGNLIIDLGLKIRPSDQLNCQSEESVAVDSPELVS